METIFKGGDNLKVLSLFSGIGSFEKALTNIDVPHEIVGHSEIDKWAIESYAAVHDVSTELCLGDVSKIYNKDLPSEVDMLTYGFPCGDVTNSGEQMGIEDGTRSGLLFEAERIIKHTKPKYAIAENVRNLVSKRFIDDFDLLLDRLDSYGYNNYWEIVNSRDHGIPQNRQRVFIVSIRKDIDDGTFGFPKSRNNIPILLDILEGDVDEKYYLREGEVGDLITPMSESEDGLPRVRVREATKLGYKVATVGDVINLEYPTSKTRRGRVGSQIAQTLNTGHHQATLEKDGRVRRLTPLEYWRLMGFSDDDFHKAKTRLDEVFYTGVNTSDSQLIKQAGNSIVVTVLEDIFKNLLKLN